MLREFSSVFVAWLVAYLLLLVRAVSLGDSSYRELLRWSGHPGVLALNVISLFFVLFHAVTWFNLAPQAMAVRVRGKRVPGVLIAGSNYAAWAAVSVLTAWLLLSGR